jgi:hypoxanthine phosphoribosyltransferase
MIQEKQEFPIDLNKSPLLSEQHTNFEELGISPVEQQFISSLIITKDKIQERCMDLARMIYNDYKGQTVVLVSVLNGAFYFQNLMNIALTKVREEMAPQTEEEYLSIHYAFIRVSSYVDDQSLGAGKAVITGNFLKKENIENKNVIVVEDIYDTGNTFETLLSLL